MFVEEVFARGGLGVIVDRPTAPWDGCFAIQVRDVRAALARAATWKRRRFSGIVAAVVESNSQLATRICQLLRGSTRTLPPVFGGENSVRGHFPLGRPDVLWQLIDLDLESNVVMLEASQPEVDSLAIARPHVLIAAPEVSDLDVGRLLAVVDKSGCVILPSPPRPQAPAAPYTQRVLTYETESANGESAITRGAVQAVNQVWHYHQQRSVGDRPSGTVVSRVATK
jgi:hypothetical protein